MAPEEMVAWLREVEAQLYRSGPDAEGRQAWVAVVRVPARDGGRGKLIISLGDTLEQAAHSAAAQWQRLWETFGAVH